MIYKTKKNTFDKTKNETNIGLSVQFGCIYAGLFCVKRK